MMKTTEAIHGMFEVIRKLAESNMEDEIMGAETWDELDRTLDEYRRLANVLYSYDPAIGNGFYRELHKVEDEVILRNAEKLNEREEMTT